MTQDQWKAMIIGAANSPDDDQLNSLSRHMADCEEANSILRHKGYGTAGQSIKDVVRGVPHARD
jgi:hypothetical protein